ncbi:MAG: alanine racemase, partial [Anaerolineae bacterium]|nr:alanine racemase [Anaerolineae bacterium]
MNAIGQSLDALDTPFLWVDLDQLEANIAALAAYFRAAGVAWRPHIKGIKTPEIAHQAIAAGAIGVTCAKLGEAEVMAGAGIRDILIANQVVGPLKIGRLVELCRVADVKVAVDCAANVRALAAAAVTAGVEVGVLVEVDNGMARAGVAPGEPVVALARLIHSTPGLRFDGIMGWEGHAVGIADPAAKRAEVERAVGLLGESARLCRAAGLPVRIVSGGGSGDYTISAHLGVLSEMQAGGAIFCDATYLAWGAHTKPSLFVRTTVTSRPAPNRIITDAGFKALPAWTRPPVPVGLPPAQPYRTSAEHGTIILDAPDDRIRVGDTFDCIVGYGDATVFLYDRL